MNYANGKIYKITGSGMTYYGSTTQPLHKRLSCHKCKLNYSSKQIIELGNYDICLVELFPCKTKEELHMRERFYIENNECINKNTPLRTNKEWRIDNKEHLKETQKQWKNNNSNKIKDYLDNNSEKNKNYQKQYITNNADKIKEYKKQYRIKNADKIKEYMKQYYLTYKLSP